MCTRGQLKRDRKPRRKLVSSGLRKIYQVEKFANKRNMSVFKRFGKKDISEMPMSAAARRADRMQQTANNQRRSLLLGGE